MIDSQVMYSRRVEKKVIMEVEVEVELELKF